MKILKISSRKFDMYNQKKMNQLKIFDPDMIILCSPTVPLIDFLLMIFYYPSQCCCCWIKPFVLVSPATTQEDHYRHHSQGYQ